MGELARPVNSGHHLARRLRGSVFGGHTFSDWSASRSQKDELMAMLHWLMYIRGNLGYSAKGRALRIRAKQGWCCWCLFAG